MSKLKVSAIHDPDNDNEALTIDSSGNVTASQGFVPSTQLSHRNLIINGAMQVAQRGTSFSVSNTQIYTLDRFEAEKDTSDMTVSQDSEAPTGFNYSLKCLNGTGSASSGSEGNRIYYYTEGYDTNHLEIGTANAKTVTLSFYVRSSVTGTYIVTITDSGNDNGYPASYTIDTADTWERKTITLTMSTYSSWVGSNTNARSFGIHWDLGSGPDRDLTTVNAWNDGEVNNWSHSTQTDWVATTGATFYLTGVQLEVGSVATPFEHRSYGEELARCQRYYRSYARDVRDDNVLIIAIGYNVNTSLCDFPLLINPPLRAAPSLEYSGTNAFSVYDGSSHGSTAIALDHTKSGQVTVRATTSSLNSNVSSMVNFVSNSYIALDSEL